MFQQMHHSFPELVQQQLVHGFYVAHRLDYSTVSNKLNYRIITMN